MQSSGTRQLTEGTIWKQLLLFFFPILMGTFFQQMYNTVDAVIVGRFVGTQALAAVGSTGPLVSMINGFFIGVGSGATVILSQLYGARDSEGAERALHTGVALAVLLGAAITILGCLAGPRILVLTNTPESCFDGASLYIRIIFGGAVGSTVYNMGSGILRAMGDSRRPLLFLIGSCVLNILLDLLFVVVLGWGVAGAAAATVAAQVISAVLLLAVLARLPDIPLRLPKLRLDRVLLWRILGIGVPAGLQFVTFDLANVLIQSGINSFGDATIAAWTAFGKTDSLTWMISGAFGVSITTFVGQNYGAGKYDRIRRGVWTCLAMAVPMLACLSALELTFRTFLLGIYTTDSEVVRIGAYIMSIVVPFNAVFMPVEIIGGSLRGIGRSALPTAITGSCVCLFRVCWLLTAVRRWHTVKMLALCYPISWCLAASVFFIVWFGGKWLEEKT